MMEVTHKVHRAGTSTASLTVVLPKSWCTFWELEAGDEVTILGNGVLVILPPTTSPAEKKRIKKVIGGK